MKNVRTIHAVFSEKDKFFENSVGNEFNFTSVTGPYEYLLGALAGCFYLTLADLPRKGKWDEVDISVIGEKRDEIPTTLEMTTLNIRVKNSDNESEFLSLVERAKSECSIFNTIAKVSEMNVNVEFDKT